MKRRILRILGIGTAVLLFTGYFAFSTFVFSPLEGDYEFDLATLVPRDVDVFAGKPGLSGDFAQFPELDFERRLADDERGARFLASPEWKQFEASLGLTEAEAELEQLLAQLPIPVDPLEVAGGRELAFATYASSSTIESSDWAAYLRTNWVGKLGVAALDYSDLIGLSNQGLVVETYDQSVRLSGGQLTRPLFVTRIQDVVIVSSAERMITAAFDLIERAGEDSLGQSASYYDNVTRVSRNGDELRIAIDYLDAAQRFGWPLRDPSPSSPVVSESMIGQFLQPAIIRELTGLIGFDQGLSAKLVGEIDPEQLTPLQKRFYRRRDADQREMAEEVARFVPADAGVFAYFEADLGDLIEAFFKASEPALRSNFESEIVRPVFGNATLEEWVADFEGVFTDRCAFMLRPNDYPPEVDGPPNDGLPTYAWAVILWASDSSGIDGWRERIHRRPDLFGIQGRTRDEVGIFTRKVAGGVTVHEYFARLVPGTGHIATAQDQDFLIVSNHALMIESCLDAYFGTEEGSSLARRTEFEVLTAAGLASATLSLWLDPSGLSDTWVALTEDRARFDAMNGIDWDTQRAQIEQRVIRESFPGEVWGSVSEDAKPEFDRLVEQEVVAFREQRQAQIVPEMVARAQRRMDAFELLSCGLVQLRLEPKDFEFSARLYVPLEE